MSKNKQKILLENLWELYFCGICSTAKIKNQELYEPMNYSIK